MAKHMAELHDPALHAGVAFVQVSRLVLPLNGITCNHEHGRMNLLCELF